MMKEKKFPPGIIIKTLEFWMSSIGKQLIKAIEEYSVLIER